MQVKERWQRIGWTGAVALGVATGLLGLRESGALMPLELSVYDRLTARFGAREEPAVVLVRIREQDIERFGYPLPDGVIAEAIEKLTALGPRAIGIDNYRPSPAREGAEGERDWARLRTAVMAEPRVVMIEKLASGSEPGVPGPSFLRAGSQLGFNDLVRDDDDAVRRAYLMDWDEEGDASLSFPLLLALRFLAEEGIALGPDPESPSQVRLGDTPLRAFEGRDGGYVGADDGGYSILMDFAGCGQLPVFHFSDLMDERVDRAEVENRVAILGTLAVSVKDEFRSPCGLGVAGPEAGSIVSGMELHAFAVDQLLRAGLEGAMGPGFLSESGERAWIGVPAVAGAVLGTVLAPVAAAGAAGAGAVGIVGLAGLSFSNGVWIPALPPMIAWLLSLGTSGVVRSQRERAERNHLMRIFGLYVSKGVAQEAWRRRSEFMDGRVPRPQRIPLTAMLSDLKGYTEAAEKMDPAELMDWINSYMDAMTQVIHRHGGHVDDYVGDGIKVNFGVPFATTDPEQVAADARAAVSCALEMGETLEELNARWRAAGLPTGRQRIGIMTGSAVVGNLGSPETDGRIKYTTVGDVVNTAARLEGFSAPGHDFDDEDALYRILIGDSTRRCLSDDFETRSIGAHHVKGKELPLEIYRVHGRADSSPDQGDRS